MTAASLFAAALLSGSGVAQSDVGAWPRCTAWHDAPEPLRELETALVESVDARRRVNGRAPLARDPRLDAVARDHSEAMARAARLSHWSRDGGTVQTRLRAAGHRHWSRVGENIAVASAAKYRTSDQTGRYRTVGCHEPRMLARELVAGWDLSPGHRDNMLDAGFSHIGSGAAYDPGSERIYVTHVFVWRSPGAARTHALYCTTA